MGCYSQIRIFHGKSKMLGKGEHHHKHQHHIPGDAQMDGQAHEGHTETQLIRQ